MLRSLFSAVKNVRGLGPLSQSLSSNVLPRMSVNYNPSSSIALLQSRCLCVKSPFPAVNTGPSSYLISIGSRLSGLLQPTPILSNSVRTVIKFSKTKGKRKTVKAVLLKFYRLNWGIWIRGRAGRHKRLYRKSANLRRKLQYHVFCNGTQSLLLDKMVSPYWRRPKHYVDDPYEPYHSREEYAYTRLKPWQPPM